MILNAKFLTTKDTKGFLALSFCVKKTMKSMQSEAPSYRQSKSMFLCG